MMNQRQKSLSSSSIEKLVEWADKDNEILPSAFVLLAVGRLLRLRIDSGFPGPFLGGPDSSTKSVANSSLSSSSSSEYKLRDDR